MTHTVAVTRDEPRDGPLSTRLRAKGLDVLWWPVLQILPPIDPRPLEEALARAGEFDVIVFASRHAVEAVTSRLPAPPAGVRFGIVGAATAAALRDRGWVQGRVPYEANAAALVVALTPRLLSGGRVLFPASSRALPTIADGLREAGAEVVQVEAYRNEAAPLDVSACRASVDAGEVGAVTFTSPSCVDELERALGSDHFERLLGGSGRRERGAASGALHGAATRVARAFRSERQSARQCAVAVALGPTTARALTARGIEPVLAESATLEGLAATAHWTLYGRR